MSRSYVSNGIVPVKVHDVISKKKAGRAIDNIMGYYGFKVYLYVIYFAIQEEGNEIQIVSFEELVRMSVYLLEKALKINNLKPTLKLSMQLAYKNLKKLQDDMHDVKSNNICLKCGTEGRIQEFEFASINRKEKILTCPKCVNRDDIKNFHPYKSKRNL